ncbi:hypothetical protein [Stutzerimonas stutzeri]|uniref:hypothetical protein n=1 Tax=Stutzerimonas stutzeri TaxID=316 RepID=UPI003B7B3ABA
MKPEHIKLLELAEKATQGEWLRDWDSECTVSESGDEAYSAWEVAGPAHVPSSRWLSSNLNKSKEDADYIVAAQPKVVKTLILELEAMRTMLEKILPLAEQHLDHELFGGSVKEMEAALELIQEAKELLEC